MAFWSASEPPLGRRWFNAGDRRGGSAYRSKRTRLFMLSRERRVTRRQFLPIMEESRAWHSPTMSLRVSRRGEKEPTKPTLFAFVVSNKVAPRAVDRNKLKRRARAIVRELLPQIKDNYACLLFFKKEARSLSYQELKKSITNVLHLSSVIL